jgi:serine/threonine protein phosphatase 1
MQTVFVTTDIHGHSEVLQETLEESGFNPKNPEHHLLILGDLFDRGSESFEVYYYLKNLYDQGKASVILGNHDLFMLEFLEGDDQKTAFNMAHNGFDKTLESFSGKVINKQTSDFDTIRDKVNERAPKLYEFLSGLPLYIEHENYIFTHGGIDFSNPEWRQTPKEIFVWNYQDQLPKPKDKEVVVGHDRTALIRMRKKRAHELNALNETLFKPIHENNVYYIDSFVEFSKRLNVLVFYLERPLP